MSDDERGSFDKLPKVLVFDGDAEGYLDAISSDRRQPKQAVAAYTGYRWPGASRASSVLKGQAGAGGFRCQCLSSGIPTQCVGAASATRWR